MKKARIENIGIDKLFVDECYKQKNNRKLVEYLIKNFKEDLLTPLCVSMRDDGRYAVVDGSKRLEVLQRLGYEEVPCIIYTGLDLEGEGKLWRKLSSPYSHLSSAYNFF